MSFDRLSLYLKEGVKKSLLIAVCGLLFLTLAIPLLPSPKAAAQTPTGQWVDQNTIIIGSQSGNHATYTRDSNGDYVYDAPSLGGLQIPSGVKCSNTISVIQVANPANSQGTIVENKWVPDASDTTEVCKKLNGGHGVPITLTNTANAALPPSGGGGGGGSSTPTCEASGFSLSWILCPIIEGAASATDGIYKNLIQPLLQTKPIELANPASDPSHIYDIWSNFRVYGDIFLVAALLVIVFGESIGGGLIDAYSAKKILPRLLVAAVLINISIYLVALAVDLTNIIGAGIAALIQAPFQSAEAASGAYVIHIGGATGDIMGALLGGGVWAVVAGGGALMELLLLMVIIPAFLTFVAILVTVILRQGLIILLILVSPVAFALYCLPNTEQYFRRWWDLLLRTLLIYPLIAIFFALGNVMSVTINATAGGISGAFTSILSVCALFAPLFLIPYSFRIAGGVLGRFHDFATTSRKRAHEGIKGNANDPNSWRNRAASKTKARFAERNVSGAGAVAQIPRMGDIKNPRNFNRQRKSRLAAARNMYQGVYGKQGMGYAMYEENKDDSNITGDLAKYATGEASRAAIERDFAAGTIDEATRQQRYFSSAAADKIGRSPAMRRRALMNPATIGYEIDGAEAGWNQATGIMRELAGGDEGTYRSMVNEFQYVAKTAAGRNDLSGAVDGRPYSLDQAWSTGQLYQQGSSKPRSIAAFGDSFLSRYKTDAAQPMTPEVEGRLAGAGRFYLEQETLAQNATGATRDAAMENVAKFKAAGIEDALQAEPVHGHGTKQVIDPATKTPVTVPITMRDLAKEGMRGYDRDPNVLSERERPPGT